jgi:hypothetical protein
MKLNTPWAVLLGLLAVAIAVLVSGWWQVANRQRASQQAAKHWEAIQQARNPQAPSQDYSLVASGEGLFVRFNTRTGQGNVCRPRRSDEGSGWSVYLECSNQPLTFPLFGP